MLQAMRKKAIQAAILFSLICTGFLFAALLLSGEIVVYTGLLALLLGALAVYQWIVVLRGKNLEGIKAFCKQADDPALMFKRLEKVFYEGIVVTDRCRMDDEYLIWYHDQKSAVISWTETARVVVHDGNALNGSGKLVLGIVSTSGVPAVYPLRNHGRWASDEKENTKIEELIYGHLSKYHTHILLTASKELSAMLDK